MSMDEKSSSIGDLGALKKRPGSHVGSQEGVVVDAAAADSVYEVSDDRKTIGVTSAVFL